MKLYKDALKRKSSSSREVRRNNKQRPTLLHDLENVLRVKVLDDEDHFHPTATGVTDIQNLGTNLFETLMASDIYDVSGMRLTRYNYLDDADILGFVRSGIIRSSDVPGPSRSSKRGRSKKVKVYVFNASKSWATNFRNWLIKEYRAPQELPPKPVKRRRVRRITSASS